MICMVTADVDGGDDDCAVGDRVVEHLHCGQLIYFTPNMYTWW